MSVTWKYVKPLESLTAVRDYLKENHIDLPEKLITLIETNNGGRPNKKDFTTTDGSEHVVKSLLSYNEKDKETIFTFYPDLFSDTAYYPICMDASGSFVCYDTNSGEYVLIDHENNEVKTIKSLPFV